VETRGVYIQDVILPEQLVQVLTQREIANQQKATYQMQQEAQRLRINMEKAKGTADMQARLAQAQVGVEIATQTAAARKKEAEGEATFIAETGRAKGAVVEAIGLGRAKGFEAQVRALGQGPTAAINITRALAERGVKIVPGILAVGGSRLEGIGATPMKALADRVVTSAAQSATLGDDDNPVGCGSSLMPTTTIYCRDSNVQRAPVGPHAR